MTARILKFSQHRALGIVIAREGAGWLVTVRDHGWLHGDREDAMQDARWLAQNLGVGIRHKESTT
jgi:hypothetical protein